MTILIDTGVFYADHDSDASRHQPASNALEAVYDGEFGQPFLSDYIYDETVTLARKRAGSVEPAKRLGARLRGEDPYPTAFEMLRVSAAVFTDAVDIFEGYEDQSLSFTDATTIALTRRHDIDGVLSFDTDFNGLVGRIGPADV